MVLGIGLGLGLGVSNQLGHLLFRAEHRRVVPLVRVRVRVRVRARGTPARRMNSDGHQSNYGYTYCIVSMATPTVQ